MTTRRCACTPTTPCRAGPPAPGRATARRTGRPCWHAAPRRRRRPAAPGPAPCPPARDRRCGAAAGWRNGTGTVRAMAAAVTRRMWAAAGRMSLLRRRGRARASARRRPSPRRAATTSVGVGQACRAAAPAEEGSEEQGRTYRRGHAMSRFGHGEIASGRAEPYALPARIQAGPLPIPRCHVRKPRSRPGRPPHGRASSRGPRPPCRGRTGRVSLITSPVARPRRAPIRRLGGASVASRHAVRAGRTRVACRVEGRLPGHLAGEVQPGPRRCADGMRRRSPGLPGPRARPWGPPRRTGRRTPERPARRAAGTASTGHPPGCRQRATGLSTSVSAGRCVRRQRTPAG